MKVRQPGQAGLQFGFSMHYGVFLAPLLGLYGLALLLLLPESGVRANLSRLQGADPRVTGTGSFSATSCTAP